MSTSLIENVGFTDEAVASYKDADSFINAHADIWATMNPQKRIEKLTQVYDLCVSKVKPAPKTAEPPKQAVSPIKVEEKKEGVV